MKDMLVIDADGHVSESNASLKKFLKEEHRSRPLQASEAWNRSLDGTLGKQNEDPRVQLADMDAEGIDVQVIYPSSRLSFSAEKLLYASDYPHWDTSWTNTVKIFMGREDVQESHKRLILSENSQRFYGFRDFLISNPTAA